MNLICKNGFSDREVTRNHEKPRFEAIKFVAGTSSWSDNQSLSHLESRPCQTSCPPLLSLRKMWQKIDNGKKRISSHRPFKQKNKTSIDPKSKNQFLIIFVLMGSVTSSMLVSRKVTFNEVMPVRTHGYDFYMTFMLIIVLCCYALPCEHARDWQGIVRGPC